MVVVVDGGDDFGIVAHLHGQAGAPVKSLVGREHTCVARLERCQLQGILVGFGTAVDKEQLVVLVARDAAQAFGQFTLQRIDDGVGVEAQLADLFRDGLDVVGMRMADADDCMAAVEVEVVLPFVVDDVATLTFDNVNVKQGINIE